MPATLYRYPARLEAQDDDPRAASKLTSLEQALAALGYEIGIAVGERAPAGAV